MRSVTTYGEHDERLNGEDLCETLLQDAIRT